MLRSTFIALILFVFSGTTWADDTLIKIDGMSISCEDPNQMPVSFSEKVFKNTDKHSDPISSRYFPLFGYQIGYNADFIKSMPPLLSAFSIYYECGLIALHVSKDQKNLKTMKQADCFAVKAMKKAGYLKSIKQLQQALPQLTNVKHNHGFNLARIMALKSCPTPK